MASIRRLSAAVCAAAVMSLSYLKIGDNCGTSHLIIYGTVDTKRQTKAAQVSNIPLPTETKIPSGDEVFEITREFTASAFLTMTVNIAAPMSNSRLPRTAKVVEAKNATVCLTRPLEYGVKIRNNE
jgi:hypothetical protein